MVLTSSFGVLIEDQMMQNCKIVLNINDIYYMVQSVTLGFMLSAIVRQGEDLF